MHDLSSRGCRPTGRTTSQRLLGWATSAASKWQMRLTSPSLTGSSTWCGRSSPESTCPTRSGSSGSCAACAPQAARSSSSRGATACWRRERSSGEGAAGPSSSRGAKAARIVLLRRAPWYSYACSPVLFSACRLSSRHASVAMRLFSVASCGEVPLLRFMQTRGARFA